MYACDLRWWDRYHGAVKSAGIAAELYTQDEAAAAKYGLRCVSGLRGAGLCREPGAINTGQNGGYQAINLAYHLGAKRIGLLGYDMQHTDGRHHWFGDHPAGLPNPSPVSEWIKNFTPLASDLDAEGIEVINCTRETALRCFPRMGLETWIETLPAR